MYARIRKLFSESTLYTLGNVLKRSFSIVTMPVFTRYMSVAEYGILSLVRPFDELMKIFLEMGASASSARFYFDEDQHAYRTRLFSTLFFFIFSSALVISLLLVAFAEPLWRMVVKDVPFSPYVVVVIFTAAIAAPGILTRTLFRVRGQARRFVKLGLIHTVAIAATAIPAVVVFDMGALGPLIATLVVSTIFFFFYLYYLWDYLAFTFSWPLLRQALSFGLPEIPVRMGNWTLKMISQLILQHYWSLSAVAVFSVAFSVASILFELVINAVHWAVQPFYYQVAKEESRAKSREIFAYVGTLNTTVILFFGLFTILLGNELIFVFASSKYAAAESVVIILAIAAIFQFLFFVPSRVFYLEKKTVYLLPLLLLAVILNVIFSLALIPGYGALGAAWANLIAFAGRSLLALIIAQRLYHIPYDYNRLGKATAVFLLLLLAREMLPAASWGVELALKLLLLMLYPILLYLFGYFQERELRKARQLFEDHILRRFRGG